MVAFTLLKPGWGHSHVSDGLMQYNMKGGRRWSRVH